MTWLVRAWREDDVEWWVDLRRSWYPAAPAAALVGMLLSPEVDWRVRAVVEDAGRPVGAVTVRVPPGEVDHLGLNMVIEPESRGRGAGTLLWREVERGLAGHSVITAMPDDDPASLAVMQRWGFGLMSYSLTSTAPLTPTVPPEPPAGVEVLVLDDDELDARGIDVDPVLLASATEPEAELLGWRFRRADLQHMNDGLVWVVAWCGRELVGLAVAGPDDGDSWTVVFTGVLPEHRRRGIGLLLKEHLHASLAARGVRQLVTDNEKSNTAILGLNTRLGYAHAGGELRLVHPGIQPLPEPDLGSAL